MFILPTLYYYKSSVIFISRRIVNTKFEIINEYFYTELHDNSIIKEFHIRLDISFDFYIEAELVVPENKINKIFDYYSNFEKITTKDMYVDFYKAQLYADIGVSKDNFDYQYENYNSAYRKIFFGLSKVRTQRSSILIFKKPIGGNVHIFLFIDKLGWDYK
jgi:hypothetical protein